MYKITSASQHTAWFIYFWFFNDLCSPNAFASYYIKRGRNVWITDFYMKFGFGPGHTQWPDLMCVFFFAGREFMKIIALDICWNSRYGQLNTEREHSCTDMRRTIKWRMWIPDSGFKDKLSRVFHNTTHHSIKDILCVEIHPCQRKHYYFIWKYKCQNETRYVILISYFNWVNM